MGRSSLISSPYDGVLNTNGLCFPSEKAVPQLVEQRSVCVERDLYLWFYASVCRRTFFAPLTRDSLVMAGLMELWQTAIIAAYLWQSAYSHLTHRERFGKAEGVSPVRWSQENRQD